MGSWTADESGFGMLFQQVEGLSVINIVALFALARLDSQVAIVDQWAISAATQAVQPS